jgi:hypothetical protein
MSKIYGRTFHYQLTADSLIPMDGHQSVDVAHTILSHQDWTAIAVNIKRLV